MSEKDLWHFPRTKLANTYFELMKSGVSNRITIFAPRRKGKTEFLIRDFSTLAAKHNYLPVYINMWENPDVPHQTIHSILSTTLKNLDDGFLNASKRLIANAINKLEVDGDFGVGLKTRLEKSNNARNASSDILTDISILFKNLANYAKKKRSKTPIILVDEIQHLSTNDKFSPLTYCLRTALDTHGEYIKAVFTGSSRSGLKQLFNQQSAPFYEFSERVDFPDMDKKFIEHMAKVYKKVTQKTINVNTSFKLFKEMDYSPGHFRATLKQMILKQVSLKIAFEQVREAIVLQNGYQEITVNLSSLEREIFVALSMKHKIYNQAYIEHLTRCLGGSITTSKIQTALAKLNRIGIITADRESKTGSYFIEAPGLKNYIVANYELCMPEKKRKK